MRLSIVIQIMKLTFGVLGRASDHWLKYHNFNHDKEETEKTTI